MPVVVLVAFVAFAVVAPAAAALVYVGLRGRRADVHPLCRRCGYDLTGRPDVTAADARCPECGADLAKPRAVRVGHRACRRGPLLAGVALLAVVAWVATAAAGAIRVWPHVPLSLVLHEAARPAPHRQGPAVAELARRAAAGELSADDWARVTAAALDYQGDAGRPWDAGWGDLIEAAHATGHLSGDQWRRCARQVLAGTPTMTAAVEPDGRLRWTLKLPAWRVASATALHVTIVSVTEVVDEGRADGDVAVVPDLGFWWQSAGVPVAMWPPGMTVYTPLPSGLSAGPHEVRTEVTQRAADPATGEDLAATHVWLPVTVELPATPADRPRRRGRPATSPTTAATTDRLPPTR